MAGSRGYTLLAALAAIFLIALAACGSVEIKSGSGDAPNEDTAVASEISNSPAAIASAATGVAKLLQDSVEFPLPTLGGLDAFAIVAAQEEVLGGIYRSALPSVVRIEAARKASSLDDAASGRPPGFRRFFEDPDGLVPNGEGSGFVWDADGYVVTNHHVIADADRITVVFADGWEVEAELVGSDIDSDLAVLKIEPPDGLLQPLALGDSDDLSVGNLTVAIGSPFGQDFSMTTGIVSFLGRTLSSSGTLFSNPAVIQTDAPINPGNSGGPLLDRNGRVIGINTQMLSRSGSSAGIGFSVPVNTAKRVVPELIATGNYEYAYLGIRGVSLRPRTAEARGLDSGTRGILVAQVMAGDPSGEAGIRANVRTVDGDGRVTWSDGDVITSIDGLEVKGMDDLLTYLVNFSRPGDTVTLGVIRADGEEASVEVTLGRRPEPGTLRPPA